ncbi:MAG TPA: 1-phosphofructokinase family hexose kinase [Ktedonosporobacter sp.]|nr:1-phosphofructokinase family hexose kinase [Ktedonosporobacter sp.]
MEKTGGYILTVVLNAAIDTTLVVNTAITLGESYKADEVIKLPGGKGINVARVLQTLGVPVHVSGCVGGAAGEFIKSGLEQAGIAATLQPIVGASRTCTAIVERATHRATEVNEMGPAISEAEAQAFLELYERLLPGAQAVTISGSVPPGLPDDYYAHLLHRAQVASVPSVLDARGQALRVGLERKPLLVKPNAAEAREFIGHEIKDVEDAVAVGRSMRELGARIVAITRGGEGAVLVTEGGEWQASLRVEKPISTVGSGDAFVAGFLASLQQSVERGAGRTLVEAATYNENVVEAFKLAIACGAANTLRLGAGILTREDVERLRGMVEVSPILS